MKYTLVVKGNDYTFTTAGEHFENDSLEAGFISLWASCIIDGDVIGWAIVDVNSETLEMVNYEVKEFYEPTYEKEETPYFYLTN